MRDMIKMVVVLTALSSVSGIGLAALYENTKDRIKDQELKFVKGPAIYSILKGVSNDPVKERFELKAGETQKIFFIGVLDGAPDAIAFEATGKGYGGDVGVMVGVNTRDDKIIGVGVTVHNETPGVGSKAQTDPTFVNQFKGKNLINEFNVKSAGGDLDAISGATITSKAVTTGVTEAGKIYKELKPRIMEKLKASSK